MKKSLLAAVLGGLAVFAWGSVSWMALPWHERALHGFADEAPVAQAVMANAPASGVYVLPYVPMSKNNTHPDITDRAMQDALARRQQGPFVYASVTREGVDTSMGPQFGLAIGLNVLVAWLIATMLGQTQNLDYLRRVMFVATAGVVIALAGYAPNVIWWHFPPAYTIVDVADAIIGWSLAGLIIAGLVEGKSSSLSFR
ncbi:MAG TPA: hypothetical protein VMH34_00415 [Gammaproteobacteria bacterium]|nr:hypothetical protein [Gammaproteobacteria bacterium]